MAGISFSASLAMRMAEVIKAVYTFSSKPSQTFFPTFMMNEQLSSPPSPRNQSRNPARDVVSLAGRSRAEAGAIGGRRLDFLAGQSREATPNERTPFAEGIGGNSKSVLLSYLLSHDTAFLFSFAGTCPLLVAPLDGPPIASATVLRRLRRTSYDAHATRPTRLQLLFLSLLSCVRGLPPPITHPLPRS